MAETLNQVDRFVKCNVAYFKGQLDSMAFRRKKSSEDDCGSKSPKSKAVVPATHEIYLKQIELSGKSVVVLVG